MVVTPTDARNPSSLAGNEQLIFTYLFKKKTVWLVQARPGGGEHRGRVWTGSEPRRAPRARSGRRRLLQVLPHGSARRLGARSPQPPSAWRTPLPGAAGRCCPADAGDAAHGRTVITEPGASSETSFLVSTCFLKNPRRSPWRPNAFKVAESGRALRPHGTRVFAVTGTSVLDTRGFSSGSTLMLLDTFLLFLPFGKSVRALQRTVAILAPLGPTIRFRKTHHPSSRSEAHGRSCQCGTL